MCNHGFPLRIPLRTRCTSLCFFLAGDVRRLTVAARWLQGFSSAEEPLHSVSTGLLHHHHPSPSDACITHARITFFHLFPHLNSWCGLSLAQVEQVFASICLCVLRSDKPVFRSLRFEFSFTCWSRNEGCSTRNPTNSRRTIWETVPFLVLHC